VTKFALHAYRHIFIGVPSAGQKRGYVGSEKSIVNEFPANRKFPATAFEALIGLLRGRIGF
jgi:hypothetical protein